MMRAIRMDKSGSVLISNGELEVWFDVWESNGELTGDWNMYIFQMDNERDLKVKALQEDADNFSEAISVAIEYYEQNKKETL